MGEQRFAGIDWASEEHAVSVHDVDGRIVEGRRYRHDERGVRALCNRLIELGACLVAIERPDGLLIDRLLDHGLRVMAVHPNQVAAMRPRFSNAGGKSDSFDAFVLAELARTDAHRFRVLVPDSDATRALRALCRAREDLVGHRVALANELRAQLDCFWPGAGHVFADIDSAGPSAAFSQHSMSAKRAPSSCRAGRPQYDGVPARRRHGRFCPHQRRQRLASQRIQHRAGLL
jgi:transposase